MCEMRNDAQGGIKEAMLSPQRHLKLIGDQYPGAWKLYDTFMADRGKKLIDWPDWCYCPVSAAHAIINPKSLADIQNVPILACMAAWRMTQGIYRFDPDIRYALEETPIEKIPRDVIYNLPEWCVYIEMERTTRFGDVRGFFAHLEWDTETHHHELRILEDYGEFLQPAIFHLEGETIEDAINASVEYARKHAPMQIPDISDMASQLAAEYAPMISVLLYLCSDEPDIEHTQKRLQFPPKRPGPVRTKKGLRVFPPDGPSVWNTAFRIGAQIRRLSEQSSAGGGDGIRQVRPHIRRAHWHSFWTGKRSEPESRKIKLRWLHPIAVGLGEDQEIKPTVRWVDR